MATGDKLVTLDGLKAVYDTVDEEATLAENAIYSVSNIEYTTKKTWGKYCRATQYNSYAPGSLISLNTTTSGFYSDLIPVGKATGVTAYASGNSGTAIICFYDSNKAYVSSVGGSSASEFKWYAAKIPSNAVYVRFSAFSTTLDLSSCKAWMGVGSAGLNGTAFISHTPINENADMNNLTDNGAYLLFSGKTYTNTPSFYSSGQAWVFVYDAFSVDGANFRMQLFIKSSNKLCACRTFTTSSGSGSWGAWTEYTVDDTLAIAGKSADAKAVGDAIAKTMREQTAINANTDLNDITETGFYLLYSGNTYTNAPAFYTSGSAWMFVYDVVSGNAHFRVQFFMKSASKVFASRTYTTNGGSGSWGDWTIFSDTYNALLGKKVSIVGDSISTYNGYIPSGYAYYYPQGDVDTVGETWWKQIVDKSGAVLLKNASWSGSCVSWISGTTSDNMAKVAYTDARIGDLADGSTAPDIVIVLMGTNDFATSVSLGTLDVDDELPAVSSEIANFKAAYGAMINNIRMTYPHAHVYCCTLIQRYKVNSSVTDSSYPIKNGDGVSLAAYNRAILDIAEWMGCEVIRLDTAISLGEVGDLTVDGTLHPNAAGMTKIADKVLQTLVQCESTY